jgi:hypothetical protein
VERCEIGDVDLLRDSALITIYWASGPKPRRWRSPLVLLRELSARVR